MKADESIERVKRLGRRRLVRRVITSVAVVLSALLQAYVIQAFVRPSDLLSSGFTGAAILIDRITSLGGVHFSTSLGMVALNIPVAIMCWRSISKRFVVFSMLQVLLASLFLNYLRFDPILDDITLRVVFGGFLYGLSIAIALKAGASTAGTDFISLMVSSRTGKTIWGYVFAGNCAMLCVFGAMFGWEHAAYSIVFQFISTKSIESFYHRYDRVTLQITTEHADELLRAYTAAYRHGSSCAEVVGGYSRRRMWLIHTVVSTYEVEDIVRLMREVDPRVVINVFRTDNFIGGFYHGAVDEPVPTEVPVPGKVSEPTEAIAAAKAEEVLGDFEGDDLAK